MNLNGECNICVKCLDILGSGPVKCVSNDIKDISLLNMGLNVI